MLLKTLWGLEINFEKSWPQVDPYFRVDRKWDHISRTVQQIIKLFSVINSLGIKYNFWQTVTSSWPLLPGQPEVGPYLKKYTTDFQTFFSYRLLGHSRLVWNTFDPCWPLLPGRPEVGQYLKKYKANVQTSVIDSKAININFEKLWPYVDLYFWATGSGTIYQDLHNRLLKLFQL